MPDTKLPSQDAEKDNLYGNDAGKESIQSADGLIQRQGSFTSVVPDDGDEDALTQTFGRAMDAFLAEHVVEEEGKRQEVSSGTDIECIPASKKRKQRPQKHDASEENRQQWEKTHDWAVAEIKKRVLAKKAGNYKEIYLRQPRLQPRPKEYFGGTEGVTGEWEERGREPFPSLEASHIAQVFSKILPGLRILWDPSIGLPGILR